MSYSQSTAELGFKIPSAEDRRQASLTRTLNASPSVPLHSRQARRAAAGETSSLGERTRESLGERTRESLGEKTSERSGTPDSSYTSLSGSPDPARRARRHGSMPPTLGSSPSQPSILSSLDENLSGSR